jgi:hypothetical protein
VAAEAHDRAFAPSLLQGRETTVAIIAIAGACALLLALPGQTQTTKYVNDLLIFLDGAYRISVGQVPNRDFHTALGPLAFYLPAAGYMLTGSLGAAMPVGTALLLLVVAPIMVHILETRADPVVAIPIGALLLLAIAAPMNLGETFADLSFGMFYNRFGWALLGLLLLMFLPPVSARPKQQILDALSAAVLVLLMLYLKVSYGLVAIAFLVFMLLDARQRSWAAIALAIVLATGLFIEAFWRSTAAHIADIVLAAEVSGAVRGTLIERMTLALRNFADYSLFAVLAGFAAWLTGSWRDALFYGFCAAAGYLLLNQNFQSWGVVTLYAGAAVAAQKLICPAGRDIGPASRWAAGAPLVLFGMLAPLIVITAVALGTHAALAVDRDGKDFALPNLQGIRLANLVSPAEYEFADGYLDTLRTGARALARLRPAPERVFVMDFVNPFSAGLRLRPPKGDAAWFHISRTFDREHFIPPAVLLNDVEIVMEPKHPVERWTYYALKDRYLPYVHAKFELVEENVNWWVWRRVATAEAKAALEDQR